MWKLTSIVACLGAVANLAFAEDVLTPVHVRAPFWEVARNPDAARVASLLRQGRARLEPALALGILFGHDSAAHRRANLESALARFERALSLDPDNPEARYLAAKALASWERRAPNGSIERRTREAMQHFELLAAEHPLFEAENVAFELGVLYTREQDFARAEAAYARALRMRLGQNSRAKVLGNLAEVVMSQGDLERAVSLYEQALEDGLRHERVLSLWGLAVALDRLGEKSESLARARQALREDVRPMGALHQSGVFFVPAYELHYYEGLGFLALAYNEASETDKPAHLARDHARVLERAESSSVLLSLKQTLSILEDEGHAALLKPLYSALERALKKSEKPAKLSSAEAPESAEVRAAKVVLHTVQALRAFARYLDRGGSTGIWATHASEHVAEISSWFDAPRGGKAARRRYNQEP